MKPDNILITDEGIPKLLDFGIAKLLSETDIKATVTRQQAFTPEYASPEQISGGAITTASDVYVLGTILYELLSGARPFQFADTDTHKEIWNVVNRTEPMRPSGAALSKLRIANYELRAEGNSTFKIQNSKNGDKKSDVENQNPKYKTQNPKLLKGDLDNIVLKALKREPERRYASVEQLTEDLRRYNEGLPVTARADTFFYRGEKFIGRHRLGLFATSLVIVSLLIGIVTTSQQSRRAERERMLAEQRAENLRAISKSVIFDVHDAIRNLPGSLPARQILLERAVEQLQNLARDADANPVLQDELAQAYFNVGEMQQATGNVAEAEKHHQMAVAIYEKLAAESPHNPDYLRGLGRGYGFLANMAYMRGEAGRSSRIYAEAPPIFERLVAENPTDEKNLIDLWDAYSNYATSLQILGKTDEALSVSERALTVAERLNQTGNASSENRQILLQTKGLRAGIYGAQGDYRKSIAQLKEVIIELEKLHSELPDDTRLQYGLWAYHRRLGVILDKAGNFSEAVETLETARGFIENLMISSPKDAGYKRNTSITLLALGRVYLNHNEPKTALPLLLKSREMSEALLAGDSENGETIADLALIYGTLAAARAQTGNTAESIAVQEKSREFFARSLAKTPENAELKREYAQTIEQAAKR